MICCPCLQEFNEHFTMFASKSYDVLDPEDTAFLQDYNTFQRRIWDLDRRLAAILCQAFDECYNLEAVFKVGRGAGRCKSALLCACNVTDTEPRRPGSSSTSPARCWTGRSSRTSSRPSTRTSS